MKNFRLGWIMMSALFVTTAIEAQSKVEITGNAQQGYQLMVNEKPFVIRGVGGNSDLELLAQSGGNAIRTWGVGPDTAALLDKAHANGITVTLGIWLGHERHGFNYSDPAQLERQRQEVVEAVRRYKDHPALLLWGLGNEMEGIQNRGDSPVIWREINHLTRLIKELDPHHPVMTVVANVNPDKVRAIMQYAPEIDILGVNAYAGAGGIGTNLRSYGWTKPYTITEFGLPGPWEVEKTPWGAPIEPLSRRKAAFYHGAYAQIMEDTERCFGTYAFLWGSKQEATASWFGMLLPTGEKTITVDAISRAWTGEWPAHRAPVLRDVEMPMFNQRVAQGEVFQIRARYENPQGEPLIYTWQVLQESSDRQVGGDREAAPPEMSGAIRAVDTDGRAVLTAPNRPGAYRVFVTVKDGRGAGNMDNWPFYVNP